MREHFQLDRTPRVLLVEDQELVRQAVRELLELIHFEVEEAATIREAVDRLDGCDVVVVDIHLPDGNGLDLLGLVQELDDPPEVLVTTGHGTIDAAIRAMHEGAMAFLMKPVAADELLSTVRRALERRRTRQDLLLHHELLRAVPAVILALDPDDRIRWANGMALECFGVPADRLVGRPFSEFVWERPGPHGDGGALEYAFLAADGTQGVLGGRWADLPGGGRIFVGRDLTRQRDLEADLSRAGTVAEMGTLVAEIIGDINNPATYLLANLSMLRADLREGRLDADAAVEMLDDAISGVREVMDGMRNIREMVRFQLDEPFVGLDLGAVVRQALIVFRDEAELLLDAPDPAPVRGARARLLSLVRRMLRFATERAGGERPRVHLRMEVGGEHVVLEVWYDGPPLSEEEAAVLFDRPEDWRDLERLGLAVARSLANEHQGSLSLVQDAERGSVLRLVLPRAGPDEPA